MRLKTVTTHSEEPLLPNILHEITRKLIADDWCRYATADGRSGCYIIGFADHLSHVSGEVDYPDSKFPIPVRTGPLAESFVRSQTASKHPDYLRKAEERLREAGVSSEAIDSLLTGDVNCLTLNFKPSISREQRGWLLSDLFQAFLIAKTPERTHLPDGDQASETDIRRQKQCLEEVSKKYAKIVDRWEQLSGLSFSDPQLEEATRCYLYGFYRAAIVLSAAALERRLKSITGLERCDFYAQLIDKTRLPRDDAAYAQEIFDKRNRVVHDGKDPSSDEAKEMLGVVRKLLAELTPK